MEEQEEIYRKFRESKREDLRLEAALAGFFYLNGLGEQNPEDVRIPCTDRTGTKQSEYAAYLRRRIRPAMELLIQREDTEKMEILAAEGWFGRREMDGFLRAAEMQKKQASLLWLLHWKNKNYGYEDDEFAL